MYLHTFQDIVPGIQRPLRQLHCSHLLRASTSCQTSLPASCSTLLSYGHTAIHSCFSCFQCSAMQKINSSGYSTSTQANLNTTSIPYSLFLSWSQSRKLSLFTLSPSYIHLHLQTSSSQSPEHYLICRHALTPLHLFTYLFSQVYSPGLVAKRHIFVLSVKVERRMNVI